MTSEKNGLGPKAMDGSRECAEQHPHAITSAHHTDRLSQAITSAHHTDRLSQAITSALSHTRQRPQAMTCTPARAGHCPQIKICGLTRPEDIDAANTYLPDYIGFVFAPSRRQVSAKQAAILKKSLNPKIKAIGVFVNSPAEEVLALAQAGIIDGIQLHGEEARTYIEDLKNRLSHLGLTDFPVIKAVRVRFQEDMTAAQKSPAHYLLLDTYVKGAWGGSGIRFDWSLIPPMEMPYFLAGGISQSNIREAMKTRACCIDISSGVETDGRKDPEKIRKIMEIARSASIC